MYRGRPDITPAAAALPTTNDKIVDPLFVDPAGLNWQLTLSSPVIDFSNSNYVEPPDKE